MLCRHHRTVCHLPVVRQQAGDSTGMLCSEQVVCVGKEQVGEKRCQLFNSHILFSQKIGSGWALPASLNCQTGTFSHARICHQGWS